MSKKVFNLFVFLLLLMIPIFNANAATEVSVKNQQELLEALEDEDVKVINLSEGINTTQKINITRDVTINGNGYKIKYVGTFKDGSKDNTEWAGIYVLQVYKANVTLKDIKLSGGNAALLVNGGNVNLEGTIDVSGNGFGGIELGKGQGVTETPKLELDNASIVNSTESDNKPSIWVPEDTENAILVVNGIEKTLKADEELSITEMKELFDEKVENPKTGDNILLYIGTIIISTLGIVITSKNILKEY